MAWTNPKAWENGDLVTEADLNTHLRDNLKWLKTPPKVIYPASCTYFTTSTDWVTVGGGTPLSIELTTSGDAVLIQVTATIYFDATSASDCVQIRTYTDDSEGSLPWTVGRGWGDESRVNVNFFAKEACNSAGTHNFKLQWRLVGGGAVRADMVQVNMMVREIG